MPRPVKIGKVADPALVVDLARPSPMNRVGVSISLKHFRRETQCFSDWEKQDLKRFGQLVEKLRGMTKLQLVQNSRLCEKHGKGRKPARFSRPADVDDDAPLWELKVDPHNTCRLHGVFEDSVFHLIHLDAHHEALKSSR